MGSPTSPTRARRPHWTRRARPASSACEVLLASPRSRFPIPRPHLKMINKLLITLRDIVDRNRMLMLN